MLSNWISVLLFLLFVAPGLLHEVFKDQRRPAVERTAFREVSGVALWSLVYSSSAFLLLTLLSVVFPKLVIDLQELVNGPAKYLGEHLWLLIGSLVLQLTLSLGLVIANEGRIWWTDGRGTIRNASVWYRVFRLDAVDASENIEDKDLVEANGSGRRVNVPHVQVHLAEGGVYFGRLAHYTADVETDLREIALSRPLSFAPKRGGDFEPVAERVSRIILNEDQISEMKVEYWEEERTRRRKRLIFRSPFHWV